jgi:uncharacterized protein YidB (DUF937 family)
MGLLDSILANVLGAGGSAPRSRSSATSPMIKALLLLLAAKAYQHYTSRPQGSPPSSQDDRTNTGMPGGFGGALPGGLGGLLGGLVGGGGLDAIVDHFRRNGYGEQIASWVGRGQNQRIAPTELEQALGPDTVRELEEETGLPHDQLLSELSQQLPDAVDQFTPDGRLPNEQEVASRWV